MMAAWRTGAEGNGGGVGGIDVVLVGNGTKTCGALGLLAWVVSAQKVRRRNCSLRLLGEGWV